MSMSVKIKRIFGRHAETRDHHQDPELRTKYFKTTKSRALETLEKMFKESEVYEFNSISETHGEISVIKRKGKRAFIIITVIMVRPNETSVDFSVTIESAIPIDFGYRNKLINGLYDQISKKFVPVERN